MNLLLLNHLVVLTLITITTLGLGLFIYLKNRSRFANKIFAVYMFSMAWWTAFEFLCLIAPTSPIALSRARLEYVGVCFIPSLFYHGILSVIGIRRTLELQILYTLSFLFAITIAILKHPLFLPDVFPIAYLPYWGRAGPLYALFLAFFFSIVVRTLYTLWKNSLQTTTRLQRKQLQLLLFASALVYIGAIPEFLLKYKIYTPGLNPFGLYLVPLHVILIAYAIIQFKLFDIHVVIRKSLVYSLLITLLTVGYFGLVYLAERTFQTAFGYQSRWLSLIAFALMALIFQPLKIGIQRVVDWMIFRAPQEALALRLERLEEEVQTAEKQKAIATLAAGMAHEIKNPLTALKTYADFIPEKVNDPAFQKRLHEVFSTETERIQQLVKELLDFAKPKLPQLKTIEPKELIQSTIRLFSSELIKRQIQCNVACNHNGCRVEADPDQLRQILINLIQNAVDAMGPGGTLTIATQEKSGWLELTISDTGEGIPSELLPKIFDPFVTTKSNGTGLGLAMVRSLLHAHHGTIAVDSRPAAGTTFTVRLPL